LGEFGSALESTSTAIADAVGGAEDALLGDAAVDSVAGAAGDAAAGVAESVVVAAGEAGAGLLSVLPGWLVSGGLAALVSEVAFAVFAVLVLLRSGANLASEVVEATGDDLITEENESLFDESDGETPAADLAE